MRILNLYCGVGGNRAKWGNKHKVTAVEINPLLAAIYASRFPGDLVLIEDAHEYLRLHYSEFDFIWSSRPCVSHSKARFLASVNFQPPIKEGNYEPIYPDMGLWEEIIFLKYFFKGKWVVENVHPYYGEFIQAQRISKHCFWANFLIPKIKLSNHYHFNTVAELQQEKDFTLPNLPGLNKTQVLRNMVNPDLGLHVLECSMKEKQLVLELTKGVRFNEE